MSSPRDDALFGADGTQADVFADPMSGRVPAAPPVPPSPAEQTLRDLPVIPPEPSYVDFAEIVEPSSERLDRPKAQAGTDEQQGTSSADTGDAGDGGGEPSEGSTDTGSTDTGGSKSGGSKSSAGKSGADSGADSGALTWSIRPNPSSGQEQQDPGAAAEVQPGQPPLGMIPRQRTWPSAAPKLARSLLRKGGDAGDGATGDGATEDGPAGENDAQDTSEEGAPAASKGRGRPRFTSGSAGVAIALVLLVAFVVVAIQLLSTLVSSVAALFS